MTRERRKTYVITSRGRGQINKRGRPKPASGDGQWPELEKWLSNPGARRGALQSWLKTQELETADDVVEVWRKGELTAHMDRVRALVACLRNETEVKKQEACVQTKWFYEFLIPLHPHAPKGADVVGIDTQDALELGAPLQLEVIHGSLRAVCGLVLSDGIGLETAALEGSELLKVFYREVAKAEKLVQMNGRRVPKAVEWSDEQVNAKVVGAVRRYLAEKEDAQLLTESGFEPERPFWFGIPEKVCSANVLAELRELLEEEASGHVYLYRPDDVCEVSQAIRSAIWFLEEGISGHSTSEND